MPSPTTRPLGPCADGCTGVDREPRVETRNSREPTVLHAPEQCQPSPRKTRARVSLVVRAAAGAQLPGQQTTRDRTLAPQTGFLPWVPGSGPSAGSLSASESFSLSRLSRCRVDGVVRWAAQARRRGEAAWNLRVHHHPPNLFLHLHCFLLAQYPSRSDV